MSYAVRGACFGNTQRFPCCGRQSCSGVGRVLLRPNLTHSLNFSECAHIGEPLKKPTVEVVLHEAMHSHPFHGRVWIQQQDVVEFS